jgi:hypothetical protein
MVTSSSAACVVSKPGSVRLCDTIASTAPFTITAVA